MLNTPNRGGPVSTGWLEVMGAFPIVSDRHAAIEDGRDKIQCRWFRSDAYCSLSPISRVPESQHRVMDCGATLREDSWPEFRSRRDPQRPVRLSGIHSCAALLHLHHAVAVQACGDIACPVHEIAPVFAADDLCRVARADRGAVTMP